MAKLRKISTSELAAELRRRQKKLPRLQSLWQKVKARLADLETQIESLGGSAVTLLRRGPGRPKGSGQVRRRGRRRRGRNATPLAEVLAGVIKKDKPTTVADAAAGAKAAGYKSSSSQFRNIVNLTLAKDKRFKKVGRGQYVLAG